MEDLQVFHLGTLVDTSEVSYDILNQQHFSGHSVADCYPEQIAFPESVAEQHDNISFFAENIAVPRVLYDHHHIPLQKPISFCHKNIAWTMVHFHDQTNDLFQVPARWKHGIIPWANVVPSLNGATLTSDSRLEFQIAVPNFLEMSRRGSTMFAYLIGFDDYEMPIESVQDVSSAPIYVSGDCCVNVTHENQQFVEARFDNVGTTCEKSTPLTHLYIGIGFFDDCRDDVPFEFEFLIDTNAFVDWNDVC
jgi:hypothetical protein